MTIKQLEKNYSGPHGGLSEGLQKDIFHKPISFVREILYTRLGLLLTLTASALVGREIILAVAAAWSAGDWKLAAEQCVFLGIVAILIYGNVLYQLTRIAYMRRLGTHRPAGRKELNKFFSGHAPTVTFLLPSYKEETRVIRQSILSTALQEYPAKRVVLLIDDPAPKSRADRESLEATRALPRQIEALLAAQAGKMRAHVEHFLRRRHEEPLDLVVESLHLCEAYHDAALWFMNQAKSFETFDHGDRMFVSEVFGRRARLYTRLADQLFHAAINDRLTQSEQDLLCEYRKLASLFQAQISSFERKRYENLSHQPNKAMNLNSYIGLLGRNFVEVEERGKLHLRPVPAGEPANLSVPASDFLVTLDADSFLSLDYALRLVHRMVQPGNERLAVIQTPYSAIPGAPSEIERIAGATTDMQYLIHQGFTGYGATFWVGANALLRFAALRDIEQIVAERGFVVSKFIQDRTVIEDTESSIDLVARGWKLYNYPERLSYSATPPDFGSLLIQRCRWANGGLIILPKLLKYLFSRPYNVDKLKEGFMRFHYLFSIAGVNLGVLMMLVYPFESNLMDFWLPLTALPYYFFYGRDLVQAGYRMGDLNKVYAMNLLLIPVNLSGVFKSIQQMATGKTIPFKRTPKVLGRTTAPAGYVLVECLILAYCCAMTAADLWSGRWLHAAFALFNACFLIYAVRAFIGLKEARQDALLGMKKGPGPAPKQEEPRPLKGELVDAV